MRIRRPLGRSIHLAAAESLPATTLLFDLAAILLLISAPLFFDFPKILTLYVIALYALHFLGVAFRWLRITSWLPLIFMLGGIAIILRYYRTLAGYEAGLALFTMLLGPKLLEIRQRRDFTTSITLGLFLIVLQFLLNQSLFKALYMLPLVMALIGILIQSNRATPLSRGIALTLAMRMVAQAVPLMVIVFLLFPRLTEPLWALSLKLDRLHSRTGLSEDMTPGSINELIRSQEVAFRAELKGGMQLPEWNLYWRGPVFWNTDGLRWYGNAPYRMPKPQLLIRPDSRIDYRIILEPHGKRWILALDLPAEVPKGSILSADFQVLSEHPVDQRSQFFLTSFIAYRTGPISPLERAAALKIPKRIATERVNKLVATWQRTANGSPRRVVDQALEFFRRENFTYTLSPPPLGKTGMEAFLFTTKAGFCEHYAGAFTLLMRIAGIPSRVVTGYLGGEYNDLGNYYLVRQEYAHAWSEVWLEDVGWMRVDPTAAVAPERIQHAMTEEDALESSTGLRFFNVTGLNSILRKFDLVLDAVNTRWQIWVLGYDTDKQAALLETLGLGFLDRAGGAILMILISFSLLGILVGILASQRQAESQDVPERLYRRFCKRLTKVGILRPDREGPQDFAKRIARRRPDLAEEVSDIVDLYIQLRYSQHARLSDLQALEQHLKVFWPKKVF